MDKGSRVAYRWVVLAVATLSQVTSCFYMQGIGAVGGHLQRDLHLSTTQVGLLLSAAQLAPLVGLLVAGELLDRYNERWVVGIGTFLMAVVLLVGALAPGYGALLAVLLLVGLGYSVAQPGGSKSVASWFPESQRGFAMGIRQAGLPLGGALAAATLPAIATRYGWRATLLTGGLVALTGALVFMSAYRTSTRLGPQRPAGTSSAAGAASGLRAQLASRFAMVREPAMVHIMLSGVSLICVQYGILVLCVLYLAQTAAMPLATAAGVLFVAQIAGMVGRILLAAWSDRTRSGRYLPVVTCMAAVILALAVLVVVPVRTWWAAVAVFAWLGFFGFGWYGPWVAYVTESAPEGKTGFALGLAMAVNQVFVILAPAGLGLLRDLTGSFTAGWVTLAVLTAAALATSLRNSRIRAVDRI